MRVICSAHIPNKEEREMLKSWACKVANKGYSCIEDVLTVDYQTSPEDSEANGILWGIIHTFEAYKNHSIEYIKN